MILWDPDRFHGTVVDVGEFSLTVQLAPCTGEAPWCITSVYDPNNDPSRLRFLHELRRIRTLFALPWLEVGDFNLIVAAEDKSSTNLNRSMMRHFRDALNSCLLKELKLVGRRFTWTNEQDSPVLVKLDRAFCDVAWDIRFSSTCLVPLATSPSDHCPLVIHCPEAIRWKRPFRFEAFWPHVTGFMGIVQNSWSRPCPLSCPVAALNFKLGRAAADLSA